MITVEVHNLDTVLLTQTNWEDFFVSFPNMSDLQDIKVEAVIHGKRKELASHIIHGRLFVQLSSVKALSLSSLVLHYSASRNGKRSHIATQVLTTKNISNGSNTGGASSSGLSAYQIAVKNGFKGSEVDFINSLKGESGSSYWKDIEGVPENIGMIDIGTELGNVYSKTQTDDLLSKKAEKPTLAPEPEPLTSYPYEFKHLYVYGEETLVETGEAPKEYALKVPIADIVKNIGNSDMRVPVGVVRTVNVTGARLRLTGLENKDNDASFNLMPVMDANGNLAVTAQARVNTTVNIPSTINVLYNSTIQNANYIPNPSTPDDIKATFEIIKSLEDGMQFTPFLASEIEFTQLPQDKFPQALKDRGYQFNDEIRIEDGKISRLKTATYPWDFDNAVWRSENEYNDLLHQFLFNRQMPSNRNWVVKFRSPITDRLFGYDISIAMGFVPTVNHFDFVPNRDFYVVRGGLGTMGQLVAPFSVSTVNTNVYFIKVGSKLSLLIHSLTTGSMSLATVDYDENYHKYFRIGMIAMMGNHGISQSVSQIKDISYWEQ